MTALLSLLTGPNGILVGLGAVLLAIVGAFMKGRISGAAKERNKQAAAETKARDIANEVDNDLGTLTADQKRKELGTWDR